MKLKVEKLGNKAVIILPRTLITKLKIRKGSSLSLDINTKKLHLWTQPPKYKLADLVSAMPDGFQIDEEWESMPPVEKEII